jgi:D-glucosaminate-6-phosphate ammonia-lyase
MPDRRAFIQYLSSVPFLGGLFGAQGASAAVTKRDFFKELGVRPFINAAGTYTTLTASLMTPEVTAAWEYASKQYVRLNELQDVCGKRIAEMIGCEAAMVTSGAAGALTVGTAACMTGTDQDKIRRIPDTTGMKTEVIIQKKHRYGYDHAVRNCGIRFVEVETREELENAINANTAMMLFFNANDPVGQVKVEEFAQLGKKHGVPTFNDAAADVPPLENISKYTKMGYDLVTFSGGKMLRGPQSAGLLLGRKDLIDAAKLNTSPYSDSIGRGCKVNKEEILAMMVAVEVFMNKDHKAQWKEWERRVNLVKGSIANFRGLQTEIQVPEIANQVPHLHITWDQDALKITPDEVKKQLREGDPAIEVTPTGRDRVVVNVAVMITGEEKIVARRLQEIFRKARA